MSLQARFLRSKGGTHQTKMTAVDKISVSGQIMIYRGGSSSSSPAFMSDLRSTAPNQETGVTQIMQTTRAHFGNYTAAVLSPR